MRTAQLAPLLAVLFVLALVVGGTVVARRRGYHFGPNTIVRCRDGHVFTTVWIPFASLKSLRLGWYRFQRCPVGPHWTLVVPVRDDDLSDADRRMAAFYRDGPIP